MYKLVIFDMDGTLIDSDLMVVLAWVELYKKFRPGYKPRLSQLIYFSGPPLRDSFEKEFPSIPEKEIMAYFNKIAKPFYDETVVAYPGTREAIEGLKGKGLKVAVDTNKEREWALYSLKITGLDGLFDFVVAGGDVRNMKPAPDGVYLAMRKAGVEDPSEVLYIGDTIYDCETAESASVDAMIVEWGPRRLPRGAKPRYHLDSYGDLLKTLGL
jgi:pyrophosphatase PpaX